MSGTAIITVPPNEEVTALERPVARSEPIVESEFVAVNRA
jgi:hypothetical protein